MPNSAPADGSLPALEATEPLKLPTHLQARLDEEREKFGKGELTKQAIEKELQEASRRKTAEDALKAEKARAMTEGESISKASATGDVPTQEALAAK